MNKYKYSFDLGAFFGSEEKETKLKEAPEVETSILPRPKQKQEAAQEAKPEYDPYGFIPDFAAAYEGAGGVPTVGSDLPMPVEAQRQRYASAVDNLLNDLQGNMTPEMDLEASLAPATSLRPPVKPKREKKVKADVVEPNAIEDAVEEVIGAVKDETSESEALVSRPKAKPRKGADRKGEDSWLGGALTTVLESEGGFQDDTEDSGNYRPDGTLIGTNKGITPNALAAYKGVDANTITVEDIKAVDDDTARAIYKQNYYEGPGIDQLPADLKETVMDMYINSGSNAIKILQREVGATADGVLGPATIQAVIDSDLTKNDYADARIRYYTNLADKKPSLKKYLKGWEARANKYRD